MNAPKTPATTAQLLEQGLFHHRRGEIPLAMERYTEVLRTDPENPDALYYVAVVACADGQLDQGISLARRSLGFRPAQARAHNLIGQALDRQGKPLEALKSFDEALGIDPKLAVAHGNKANILMDAGLNEEALKSFDRALALDPMSLADWVNRGALLNEMRRHDEALASFEKAEKLAPEDAAVLVNKASTLSLLRRDAEAVAIYDRLIKREPKASLPYARKALAVKQLGRLEEARALFEKALERDPKDHTTAYALARLLLQMGDWKAAWPLFERRAELPEPPFKALDYPRWAGQAPGDFRLVLMSEQGLGDTIHFGRYAALLAGRGHAVTLLTTPVLAPLMRTLPGVEKVITSTDALKGDPRRTLWLPLMSTMAALHLSPTAIPAQDPYLAADPARVAQWRERLGDGFKIGILWHGVTNATPLSAFAPLAAIPGARLISLQKGDAARQIGTVDFGARIEQPLDWEETGAEALLDTAAVIANLDLVVSIESMPAHLAGALGRPVYLALTFMPDWRWFKPGEETPWYPTMRLFRQDANRGWAPVFERLAAAVRDRMAKDGTSGGA